MALGLSACIMDGPKLTQGSVGYVTDFMGGVVADEPRAALIGRDILSSGGAAADAATAMYFALSATMPSRAGLAGGGMCVAFDVETGETKALDFTARSPSIIPPFSDRPTAIPGNPRGFFALQARYGVLDWRATVAPGEKLARFGFPASRAFSQDLLSVGPALMADQGARKIFSGPDGLSVATEGEKIANPDLAGTLGMLRASGVGPFYTGPFASQFVEDVRAAGGSLDIQELRAFRPQWRDTVRVDVGFDVAHFAPPPAAASTQAAVMLAMLIEDGQVDTNDEAVRASVLADASVRSFADRETWLSSSGDLSAPQQSLTARNHIETLTMGMDANTKTNVSRFTPEPKNRLETAATTSFAAVDQLGNAVACSVTMNANFGTGRVLQGSGILLSAAPSTDGRGPLGLAPMLMVNENSKVFRLAAVAGGGAVAPTALASVLAGITQRNSVFAAITDRDIDARDVVNEPRVHNGGDPDVTYVERGLASQAKAHLSAIGHNLKEVTELGIVHVLHCPDGLPTSSVSCVMAADPRGAGLAVGSMIK